MEEIKTSKLVEFSPCNIQGCNNQSDVTTTAISLDNIPEGITVIGRTAIKIMHFSLSLRL